jgi:hypothetical protein
VDRSSGDEAGGKPGDHGTGPNAQVASEDA